MKLNLDRRYIVLNWRKLILRQMHPWQLRKYTNKLWPLPPLFPTLCISSSPPVQCGYCPLNIIEYDTHNTYTDIYIQNYRVPLDGKTCLGLTELSYAFHRYYYTLEERRKATDWSGQYRLTALLRFQYEQWTLNIDKISRG